MAIEKPTRLSVTTVGKLIDKPCMMGLLAFFDELKPTSLKVIRQFKSLNTRTFLVTGYRANLRLLSLRS